MSHSLELLGHVFDLSGGIRLNVEQNVLDESVTALGCTPWSGVLMTTHWLVQSVKGCTLTTCLTGVDLKIGSGGWGFSL